MKNYEIYNANAALSELIDVKLKGAFKFKVFKVKATLEDAVQVIVDSLEGVEDDNEHNEILNEEQDIKVEKFSEEELEQIDLTMKQIAWLEPLIEFKEEK